MTQADPEDLADLDLHTLLERTAQARARARALLRRLDPPPAAETASEHDLSAQLTLARDDMRTLDQAVQHAWDLDLGYGPGAITFSPRVATSREGSPALSHGHRSELDTGYHQALDHIALAHHHYGDLPAGQTIWPIEPLVGTDRDGIEHRRTVPIDEARAGIATLDLALAELQRTRHDLGAQEIAVALDVATEARNALRTLPAELWETVTDTRRPCVGVPGYVCNAKVQDRGSRCYACRHRHAKMARAS